MSGAGSRDKQSLVLRYNYFLNTLEASLAAEATPLDTLHSQYKDLLGFVRSLTADEKAEIQRDNKDWGTDRRRALQERCQVRGVV
mmetsp:Transcript_64573/g.104449  ORF Transcript_64573/g.104449 Transcript_64573/m.104449 type:complete len:85 (-) Transcript_64573:37-291(-)